MEKTVGREPLSLVAYPLEEAEKILVNMGYKVLLRELSSPRSKLYAKKCVLRAEFAGELPDAVCIVYWASFLELDTNDGDAEEI